MPLPIIPNDVLSALRLFARQSKLSADELLQIVSDAIFDPDADADDADTVVADATILPPDEGLDLHPLTTLSSMGPRRARRLAGVATLRGYQRITTTARRRRIRSAL